MLTQNQTGYGRLTRMAKPRRWNSEKLKLKQTGYERPSQMERRLVIRSPGCVSQHHLHTGQAQMMAMMTDWTMHLQKAKLKRWNSERRRQMTRAKPRH